MRNSRRQNAIAAITLSAALAASCAGGTLYLYHAVKRVKEEIGRIRGEIATLEAENNSIREFHLLSLRRAANIERIKAFFPERNRPLAFIEAIETLGHRTGNKLAIDAETPRANDQFITFRLSVEGKTQNISQFIRLLELMPYEISIESFGWNTLGVSSQKDADAERNRLEVAIRVKTK